MVTASEKGMRVRDDQGLQPKRRQCLQQHHSLELELRHRRQPVRCLRHQQRNLLKNHWYSPGGGHWLWPYCKFKGTSPKLPFVCILWLMIRMADSLGPPYPEPEFLPRLLNVTAREGGTAKLPCAVHFLGTREVAWRRFGANHFIFVGKFKFVKDSKFHLDFVELTPEVTEWNLVISKLTPSDAGDYECQVTSTVKMNRLIRLNVVGPPIVEEASNPVIALSGKRYVDQGQPMKLVCNVSGPGFRDLRIEWFKDGNVMDRAIFPHIYFVSYGVEATKVLVSELRIDRTRKNDTGLYICRSSAGYIDNLKVTILSANTPKEKRGNPDEGNNSTATVLQPQCLLLYVLFASFIVCVFSTSITDLAEFSFSSVYLRRFHSPSTASTSLLLSTSLSSFVGYLSSLFVVLSMAALTHQPRMRNLLKLWNRLNLKSGLSSLSP